MHIAAIGAVVTPAQQLLSVVPEDDHVEVEAVLENRDIGFVKVGQRVELKIDVFAAAASSSRKLSNTKLFAP